MSFSAVANVFFEMVVWVFIGKVYHVLIASDFGNDGSGRDFADFVIGFNASGGVFGEWSLGQEVNFAIYDDLGKRGVKSLN